MVQRSVSVRPGYSSSQKLPYPNLPKSLQYFISTISNFRRDRVTRGTSIANSRALPGDTIEMQLNNGIPDKATLTVEFDASTTSADNTFCQLPPHTGSLFSQMTTESPSGIIDPGVRNQHLLFQLVADCHYGQDQLNRKAVLENALSPTLAGQVIGLKDDLTGIDPKTTSAAATAITANDTKKHLVYKDFMGFWASMSPQYLCTSLLGNDIRISLTLADTSVLVGSTGGTANECSYYLENIKFSVDYVDFEDNTYMNAIKELASAGAIFDLSYTGYHNFPQSWQSMNFVQNFGKSCESIDYLWHSVYNSDSFRGGANVNKAVPVYSLTNTGTLLKPACFIRDSTGLQRTRFTLNGDGIPEQSLVVDKVFTYLEDTLGCSKDYDHSMSPFINSLSAFLSKFYVFAVSLCMGGGDPSVRSGFSTTGSNTNFEIICEGDPTARNIVSHVWMQYSSRLESKYNQIQLYT